MCLLPSLKWSSTVSSLGILQWNFTRRDHLGDPGRVSGSGPVRILPTRATSHLSAHAMFTPISQPRSTRTCQFYMEFYISCHEMRCGSSCTMRRSPHRLPHTTPKPMFAKPSFRMTSNDHFQNKFHLFIN